MAHKPAYHLRPLTRFDPTFQEKAADLFGRVKSRIGEGALTRTGSYSFRELPQRFASTPRRSPRSSSGRTPWETASTSCSGRTASWTPG